jgi:ABC-type lipopolysaccharide export system ATPase subunit
MSTANHIVVERLVKRFQEKVVVDGISLNINLLTGELS